jgi:hypothetical protein
MKTMDIEMDRRKIGWLNVQNVELKFRNRKRLGRWLGDRTNQARELNLKSDFMSARNVITFSEKFSARRRSKRTNAGMTRHPLFFIFVSVKF